MNRVWAYFGLYSLMILQGCFEGKNDSPNKKGDTSKSSLQIQQGSL